MLVDSKKEAHPEAAYYPNLNGQWQKVEVPAERLPEPECREELLSDASARSLEELDHKVAGKTRR